MTSKSIILKHLALLLAVLMFSTSVGIAVDFHYCQGELQNISFFKKAKNCHEKARPTACHKAKKACHHSPADSDLANKKKKCCDNQAYFYALDSDFGIHSLIELEFNKTLLAINLPVQETESLSTLIYNPKDYKYYKPPSRYSDHIVLFQSFLI